MKIEAALAQSDRLTRQLSEYLPGVVVGVRHDGMVLMTMGREELERALEELARYDECRARQVTE